LFKLLYTLGISDPQDLMLIVRFLHSLYSAITVVFIFKILKIHFEERIAFRTAILLPLLWFMPFLSVRNLIEMVCIPPVAIGFYFLLKPNNSAKDILLSSLFFALAFAFRYQTLMISGTIFLILLYKREFKSAFVFGAGLIIFAFSIQGSVDIFAWGYPFASFIEYVRYNLSHSQDYVTGPFYRYFLLLVGIFIPPLSFFVLYYLFHKINRTYLVVVPILVFFVFHSIFPNKQERFILPVVPFIFALGLANFLTEAERKKLFSKWRRILNITWGFFWLVNIPLWLIFSFNYGKKTRCESLYFLSKKEDVEGVFQITGKLGTFKPPEFYLNKYGTPIVEIPSLDSLKKFNEKDFRINYAIIFGDEEQDSLKIASERILGRKLLLQKIIEPSVADWILYKLNPKYNKNQVAYIYKIE
jgi:hypothetical protein